MRRRRWLGVLQRALTLSPDSGVIEDIGFRLPFEEPSWAGEHPAADPEEDESVYPFHSIRWSWEKPRCSSSLDISSKEQPRASIPRIFR